jgi:hypothetical protein
MPKAKQYERYERLKDLMGEKSLLEEIVQGLSSDELKESLDYIVRMHDLSNEMNEDEDKE